MITIAVEDSLQQKENRQLEKIKFGTDNRYPNNSKTIAYNSGAIRRSINVYQRFIFGRGMTLDSGFWKAKINWYGLTVDQLNRAIIHDYSIHKGFALHIGYDGTLDPVSITPVPFETLRLRKPDDNDVVTMQLIAWISTLQQN